MILLLSAAEVFGADSTGARNAGSEGVAMGRPRGWGSAMTGRPVMRSPGHPPGWRREHKQRFWAGIARGVSSDDAAIEADVSIPVGVRWFREGGGMPAVTRAPLLGRYLSFAEREEIAILRAQGAGVREIAQAVSRSPSMISGELRRNATTRGGSLGYRALTAQWHSDKRAKRPKAAKLAVNEQLRSYVQERLAGAVEHPDGRSLPEPRVQWIGRRHGRRKDRRWAKAWSPEQISNRLRLDFPDDESMRISHEAIYQALYVQSRGALRRELTACLRSGRALRVPRARVGGRGKSFVNEEIMISERPAEAEDARCLATGRAISSSALTAPRSGRWSSAPPGSRCCFTSRRYRVTERQGLSMVLRSRAVAQKRCATRLLLRSRRCPSSCADPLPGIRAPRWQSMLR